MRPRLITAENSTSPSGTGADPTASMRPRLITAENTALRRRYEPAGQRFNEAAAHHRGERDTDFPTSPARQSLQ